jgi:hypothetical protein
MLSDSIINTYSSWKNNSQSNTFQKPLVKLPPKYTTNPLGMGSGFGNNGISYLSNMNLMAVASTAPTMSSVSLSVLPVKYNGQYGNYILVDDTKQTSVIAEDGSEISVVDESETEIVDLDVDASVSDDGYPESKTHYVNLDNYRLNDPIIQFYFGSITVIGLFILFRLMSKTK